jgi:O-antigen/teichoic acid export membrane protein
MFVVLTDLGLGQLAVREIARDASIARRYVSSALAIKLAATVIVVAVIVLLVNALGYPKPAVRAVCICSLLISDSAFTLFYRYVFQAFERTVFAVIGRVIQTVILAAGLFASYRSAPSVEYYAWLYAGSTLVAAVFSWVVTSLFLVRPGLSLDLKHWAKLLGAAAPVALAALLVAVYYWNGSTVLAKVKGDSAVGVYSAALRLVLGLSFLSSAFANAMYPVMARVFATERQRLAQVLERSLRYVAVVGIPLGVLGTTLAGSMVRFLYGLQFNQSALVLRVLVWWGTLMYFNCMMGYFFMSIDRARIVTMQAALSLGVNVALNVVLIPSLGALGAAISLVAAELVGFVFLMAAQLRTSVRLSLSSLASSVGRGFSAAVAAAPIAWLAGQWHALAGLAAGLAAYCILLVLFRAVGSTDIAVLRSMLPRARG